MKKFVIYIILLINLCLYIPNVFAIDYTEAPYNDKETVIVGTPNNPVDSSDYVIDNNSSLEGGGIYLWYEKLGFYLVITLIVGTTVYLIIKKKKIKRNKGENSFYEE